MSWVSFIGAHTVKSKFLAYYSKILLSFNMEEFFVFLAYCSSFVFMEGFFVFLAYYSSFFVYGGILCIFGADTDKLSCTVRPPSCFCSSCTASNSGLFNLYVSFHIYGWCFGLGTTLPNMSILVSPGGAAGAVSSEEVSGGMNR